VAAVPTELVAQWRKSFVGRASRASGADRDRTDDLRLAKPALSQLSYSPGLSTRMVGQGRVELPTSRLSGVRSNHLSYWPRFTRSGWVIPSAQVNTAVRTDTRSLKTEPM
jgi:hypothetical protein